MSTLHNDHVKDSVRRAFYILVCAGHTPHGIILPILDRKFIGIAILDFSATVKHSGFDKIGRKEDVILRKEVIIYAMQNELDV